MIGSVLTVLLFFGSILLLYVTLDSYQSSGGLAIASYIIYLPVALLTVFFGSLTAFAGRGYALADLILMALLILIAGLSAGSAASSGLGDSFGTMFLIFAGPAILGVLVGLAIFLFKYRLRTTV